MAMTLNLTVAVQIVHFLIAYFLLTRYLLRPGYEFLKAEENRLHQLKSAVIGEQEKLSSKKEYKRKRWEHCQNYFALNRPQLEEEHGGFKSTEGIEQLPSFSENDLARVSVDIIRSLKDKVLHD
jgi:hypothetical protein